jgi:hypothetical protein
MPAFFLLSFLRQKFLLHIGKAAIFCLVRCNLLPLWLAAAYLSI